MPANMRKYYTYRICSHPYSPNSPQPRRRSWPERTLPVDSQRRSKYAHHRLQGSPANGYIVTSEAGTLQICSEMMLHCCNLLKLITVLLLC